MASTPEGSVKKKVTKLLQSYKDELHYWMPVPSGYGVTTVDYLGVHMGMFFCIEAKAPGKKPTLRQEDFMKRVRYAGGRAFVVEDEATLAQVKEWLDR